MKLNSISTEIQQEAVNTLRFLSIDQVEAAKSGHPGLPMGIADIVFVLFSQFLNYNPNDPDWHGRDRFVLSPGHGSALLYSILHIAGYDLSMDELKRFRQWGSKTPGHPELDVVPGVETTTGPLGQGFANGVGMAIIAKTLKAKFERDGSSPFDYKIYGIVSDGDLMEGISSEAGSIAGNLGLDNLVYIYDSNEISIEGSTSITFTENVAGRFESFGWVTKKIDGHDRKQIADALTWAQDQSKPVMIIAKTTIGFGSPNKSGKSSSHGSPLGAGEANLTRENLGWKLEPFSVPKRIYNLFEERKAELIPVYEKWEKDFDNLLTDANLETLWMQLSSDSIPEDLEQKLLDAIAGIDKAASRASSGKIIQKIAEIFPSFMGGSADLAPSNKTEIANATDLSASNFLGRNIRFGVREHAMASICNGMALSGLCIPYCATFLIFTDYMRNSMRMASLMDQRVIYVLTHDSFYLGEDGPTHQPVEQISSLRAMPGMLVLRPADARETAYSWAIALRRVDKPTAIILTRQGLPTLSYEEFPKLACSMGGYLLKNPKKRAVTFIASGSEVSLALDAAAELALEGIDAAVVSLLSYKLFKSQSEEYIENVLGNAPRVVIEAGTSFGLEGLAPGGLFITRDDFGQSAPANVLAEKFGFTKESVVSKVKSFLV